MDRLVRTSMLSGATVTRNTDDSESNNVTSYGFRGHSIVFGQPTLIGSRNFGFIEVIAPGATRSVQGDDVRFLINHDGLPLARTTNGTLRLSEDDVGQVVDADLAPTRTAEELSQLLARGDINQMSFAFGLSSDDFTWGTYESSDDLNGMDMRTINSMSRQYDVSAVTYPAYEGTDAGVRSLTVSDDEIREALRELRSDQNVEEQMLEEHARRTLNRSRWLDLNK